MATIGVTLSTENESDLTWKEAQYLTALRRVGATDIRIVRNTSEFTELIPVLETLDGLLLTGGGDVHPRHYGRSFEEGVEYSDINDVRDLCELQLARWAHHLDLPTLGICRGCQIMNVSLGGTLVADIPTHFQTPQNHLQEVPYERYQQIVHVKPGTKLFDIMFDTEHGDLPDIDWIFETNSMHHQAIEHTASPLRINALGTDGIYEGCEDPAKQYYIGVQWHPEYLSNCTPIFESFLAAAEAYRARKGEKASA